MSLALAVLVVAVIALPHLLCLQRATPAIALSLWASALALRALTDVLLALWLVLFVPHSRLFDGVTHWCWEAVMPVVAAELGVDGHRVGDVATLLPSLVLGSSVLWVTIGAARAARSVHRLLTRDALAVGPDGAVVVGGSEILVAVAGIAHPRLIVSAGALTILDDEELAAGLDHERGHIAHHHRFLFALSQLCWAVGRFLPGARRARRELAFHLERDADQWALRRRHDPFALASAICKAASVRPGLATLGGSGVTERLGELMEGGGEAARSLKATALRLTAAVSVALTLAVAALVPPTAIAGAQRLNHGTGVHHCHHRG